MKASALGKINYNGIIPLSHEEKSLKFLQDQGCVITLVPRSQLDGIKTPDLVMDGKPWDLKTVTKAKIKTVERSFASGLKQAPNLIYDLRNLKQKEAMMVQKILERNLAKFRQAKRLWIITKDGKLLKFDK